MALTKCIALLALFCGAVSASWGPSNLVAEVDDSEGDFVNFNVQWKAGDCPTAKFHLYTQTPNGPRIEETSTRESQFTIEKKEFWTNYTIILETSWCIFGENRLQIEKSIGPGNPHPVKNVETVSSAVDANITIEEAFMPKIVDMYNITLCWSESCKTMVHVRNQHKATTFTMDLHELLPSTRYDLSIVPAIAFQGETYRGRAYEAEFVTADVELPIPSGFEATFPWHGEQRLVKLTWKLSEASYDLAFYNVTVTCESDAAFVESIDVTEPEVTFTDLPFSKNLTVHITPVFNISHHLMCRTPGVFRFETPHTVPVPIKFASVGLDANTLYAQWDTSVKVLSPALLFVIEYSSSENDSKTVNSSERKTILRGLEPNTTYEVLLSVLPANTSSSFNFTTLDKDYAAPVNVIADLLSEGSDTASYDLKWNSDAAPRNATFYRIISCKRDTGVCTQNETEDAHEVIPLEYFADYDLRVDAIYELDLNQTQVRSGEKTNLTTPGTSPSAVTNIQVQNVSTTTAVLTWSPPANLPVKLSRTYQITDAPNNVIASTEEERIELTKLGPYSLYNITIQTTVSYNGSKFDGSAESELFYTDSAAPGPPESVTAEQHVRTNTFKVSWTVPKVKNGKLDYYEVETKDSEDNIVSSITGLVGTRGITVRLPSVHGDANFTVSVRAVNINLKGQPLPGPAKSSALLFKGIGAPSAEVIKRLSSSLLLEMTPSNDTEDTTGLYYIAANAQGDTFRSTSKRVEVKNLRSYTPETIAFAACFLPTFCSESVALTSVTNVAGPSAVNDLTSDYANLTNPVFKWAPPTTANGPLDGYVFTLRDLTNKSVNFEKVLPFQQLSFTYESDLEFEKYNFSVSAFNYDLDDPKVRVSGELSSILVKTAGRHPPKPENVQELNKTSTSAFLQWEKPDYPGFKVAYYHIEVPALKYQEITNKTSFVLEGLKPYTNTTVLTRGCTSDKVDSCGLPGAFEVATRVDTPSEPLSVTVSDVTQSEFSVSWKAPNTPNGPIDGYKVAISQSGAGNLTWITVEEKQVKHKFSNLTSASAYTVHVLAYNIDEDTHEEYDSKPASASFETVGSGSAVWWIVALVLVLIAVGVGVGILLYRRRTLRNEDMG
ncbi:phosphatidylinositol phosphatase PTPRQ [Galendromus occidentalis]|uniref:Phosphatidylinositol phosphatase PTPRQ n=1 Tax=Galendromus occidentalis TaxID=34638 RepID=A0AAJ6QQ83_9ACAR|nr:phosphatidylinositol phosphatase PTPRQ [Galendromus occidentalis]